MAETDKPISAIESSLTTSSPVLNISGKVPNEPAQPRVSRKKNSKKGTTDVPAEPKPEPAPTININTFPVILSRILLKLDEAPNKKPPDDKSYKNDEYVCIAVFINKAAYTRLHHMFRSINKNMDEDLEKVKKLYENRKDLEYKYQSATYAICARSLYHSVQKDLQEFKWNKAGNVFETSLESEFDNEWLYRRTCDVGVAEMEKLFNYIKFLGITKQ